jgi:hypothetical protein
MCGCDEGEQREKGGAHGLVGTFQRRNVEPPSRALECMPERAIGARRQGSSKAPRLHDSPHEPVRSQHAKGLRPLLDSHFRLSPRLASASHAAIVTYNITADPGDGEVRQSSTGTYSVNQVVGTAQLRVGFQSGFGSDGQSAGGLNAVWFLQLPKLTLGNGVSIDSAHFITTLLDENATSPITPRFNADLYALGFVSAPTIVADGTFFFAGQDQTGPGLGAGQTIQKIDDDMFVIFQDWQDVNSVSPKHPKPTGSDLSADQNLAAYIESIYLNPAFPNTGNEYLAMRLNPDRAANETYERTV